MLKAWFAAAAVLALTMALIGLACDKQIDLGVAPDVPDAGFADADAGD
jgi:hypothetical protein